VEGVTKYTLPSGVRDSFFERLCFVHVILSMLVHVFSGDADTDEPSATPGLMGAVQHVEYLLDGLNKDLMEISEGLPEDLRWRIFEARDLIALIEHLEFNNNFKFNRHEDGWTCDYFASILHAVKRARGSLEEIGVEVQHG